MALGYESKRKLKETKNWFLASTTAKLKWQKGHICLHTLYSEKFVGVITHDTKHSYTEQNLKKTFQNTNQTQ